MSSKSFVHLHNHTDYSMLDGAAKVVPLLTKAKQLGMNAVGMTDHGNMFGASEFYNEAVKLEIKPIIGIEAYIAPSSRFETKRIQWGDLGQKSDDVSGRGAYTHMTMIAENANGLRNLFKLSSLASFEGRLGKWARMDDELISKYSSGIIATTGCPSGEIQTRLRLGQQKEALEAAAKWRDIFGRENFFLELMDHGLKIEHKVRDSLLTIGRKLKIPPLATNDCHYVTRGDSKNQEALLCIQTGKTMSDPNRFKFDGDGYYLKSSAEMRSLWDNQVPGACDSTLLISERVQSYADVWKLDNRMPLFPVSDIHSQDSWLIHKTHNGLKSRTCYISKNFISTNYIQRINYELKIICDKGFSSYFLIVADLINYARSVGIRVGPGRGSVAGSLVAYALEITSIDPIRHGLIFERFLNPERPSIPDIDIDFDDRRRGEILQYVADKWGSDKVAQVITFGTIKTKAAFKDSARIHYGQSGFAMADRIIKALPPAIMAKDIPVSGITDTKHERYKEAHKVRKLIKNNSEIKTIFETAYGIEGLVRNAGVHACAVIMSSSPLIDLIPLWKRPQDGAIITGWDYPACEAIGLLKMDFLGLRNLTIIEDCLENIRLNRKVCLDLEKLPLNDEATYRLLSSGETLGIFQLDGNSVRDLLKRMQPTEFSDIVAVLALYRPGPMGMNAHIDYADRKNGRQSIKPIHSELEIPLKNILSETYGLIVYQEQIMLIAQKLASYTMSEADALREAMGKKKLKVLEAEYNNFYKKMISNGFSSNAVNLLWDTVLPFAGYAFNKSHAASYGLLSYWTAYLKANYPAEYMASLLTSVSDDKDKSAVYLADCRRLGITVLPPDINESVENFIPIRNNIRFGLSAIRNIGINVVNALVNSRSENSLYVDFFDYLNKIDNIALNKKTTESLIKAGAFDSFGYSRKGLFLIHTNAVNMAIKVNKAESIGQFDLFSESNSNEYSSSAFSIQVSSEEWDNKQKLSFEREMLGLYISSHPLQESMHLLSNYNVDAKISSILNGDINHNTQVLVGGILASANHRVSKSGLPWASAQLDDLTGVIEVLFFSQVYSCFNTKILDDTVVLIKAKVVINDEKISLVVQELIVPDSNYSKFNPSFKILLSFSQCTEKNIKNLKQLLSSYPGNSQVYLHLINEKQTSIVKISSSLKVNPSSLIVKDLKALFGPSCLSV